METWQRAVGLAVGAVLVLGAALNDEPRWAILAVGLVLMGVLTVDQLLGVMHRGSGGPPPPQVG